MTTRRKRRPIVPHVCPAAPDDIYHRFTAADLRRIGRHVEAGQLERAVQQAAIWSPSYQVGEFGLALSIFGCCKQAELAAEVLAARS
jgi:hypothetical protein